MIRWRFVLTRFVVIVAVLVLLRWGLGPVANYVTIRGLESVTGAKVEIAKTRVGLFPPRVQYVDLHIADPRDGKEMRDAFRADSDEPGHRRRCLVAPPLGRPRGSNHRFANRIAA